MTDPRHKIGFMQGRLSPLVDGKIQAFPWQTWQDEFAIAARCGFAFIEWTLDQERLCENPLMSEGGREEIRRLMASSGMLVPSLTGDCFMQAPFFKAGGGQRDELLLDLVNIIRAAADVGIGTVLIPLVDDGRLEDETQERSLLDGLAKVEPELERCGVRISFESEYPPNRLARFIRLFDDRYFGITYDIGNSAALGYDPNEETAAYGERVVNVHVKDRIRSGTTVPLSTGDANIPAALRALRSAGYDGNYILQTARATDGDHEGVLCGYRDLVGVWLSEIEAERWNLGSTVTGH